MRRAKMFASLAKRKLALVSGIVAMAGLATATQVSAAELEKVVFGTNWFAQAEHGGFYQAKATGIYAKYGLDVTIEMGGPQVNSTQLMVSGRRDFVMGYPMANVKGVEQGLPIVTVAAVFQSDPQALLAHPHVKSFEDIKANKLPVYIASTSYTSFWPWLKAEYGFTDDMARPYTFSVAPFLADKRVVQQGYITSEPFAIEQGGVKPSILLMADFGYPPYAQTIDTTTKMIKEKPDLVKRFVQASLEGWVSYLKDPEPGNKLIKEANPQMTDEQIVFGLQKMAEYGLVVGNDAKTKGIGVMTDARWKALHDFMLKAGLISDKVKIEDVYSLAFLPEKPVLVD